MTGRVPRCANNIDRSSCCYSSRRINLQVPPCLRYRISMTHRTHATTGITTSPMTLTSVIRPSVAIPSDSTTSLSLVELHTTFKPLRSRNLWRSPAHRLRYFSQRVTLGREFLSRRNTIPLKLDKGTYQPFYRLTSYLSNVSVG